MRRSTRLGAIALLLVLPLAVPGAAPADPPTLVGVDDLDDWGITLDPTLPPVGDALGQDLFAASIQIDEADPTVVNFIITLKSLPPIGGAPEVSRYTWDMNVITPTTPADGVFVELDGKFTNYSRGACDPTSGQCPPPRDPGLQPFFVRGNCADVGTGLVLCEELGIVQGVFDATAATITIPVPISLLGPAECPKAIVPGVNIFGGSISATPAAFFTSGAMPMDTMDLFFDEGGGEGNFAYC